MVEPLPPSVRRVQDALTTLGADCRVITLARPARTAAEAAAAVGCQVAQIAKSLVFRLRHTGTPLLILVSGANRVDEARVAALVGEPLDKADAEFVRVHTGFAIGGVPPVGHPGPLRTLVDEDLLGWESVWAAAGHPATVFAVAPTALVRATGARVAMVK